MTTIYFAGQSSFGNRGCEALIRSSVALIRNSHPQARFLCPSSDAALDRRQWPEAEQHGVQFVPAPQFSKKLLWWGRALRLFPQLIRLGFPAFSPDVETLRSLAQADSIVVTGGDNISLDYGLPSLCFWVGIVEAAMRVGKPAHLWANSIGPFSSQPFVERVMLKHLKRYSSITARESETIKYLKGLGLANVAQVADPAFVLEAQAWSAGNILDSEQRDLLGFNVSPLIRKFRPDRESREILDREVVEFLRNVLLTTKFSVALIPHVDPFDERDDNSDSRYMASLLHDSGLDQSRITLLPSNLNAAQIKYVIGRCRYFIGTRTHATIASLSQGIPTISIAYSVKAVGINKDLFGHTDYVLPTPSVSAATLNDSLRRLQLDEDSIHKLLEERLPVWKKRSAEVVASLGFATNPVGAIEA